MLPRIEEGLRANAAQYLYLLEGVLYTGVGVLLSAAAGLAIFEAGAILWHEIAGRAVTNFGVLVLDQLLLVLMLVEILHTVRISIRSQELIMEPFLIVGLIASIRRILVITMQAAKLTQEGHAAAGEELAFRNSMIELGVLGALILILVFSIFLLRRTSRPGELLEQ